MNAELRDKRLARLKRKIWHVKHGDHDEVAFINGWEVIAVYEALVAGDKARACEVLEAEGFSDRRADRVLQILKVQGLIVFDKQSRTWKTTS